MKVRMCGLPNCCIELCWYLIGSLEDREVFHITQSYSRGNIAHLVRCAPESLQSRQSRRYYLCSRILSLQSSHGSLPCLNWKREWNMSVGGARQISWSKVLSSASMRKTLSHAKRSCNGLDALELGLCIPGTGMGIYSEIYYRILNKPLTMDARKDRTTRHADKPGYHSVESFALF